ncbi:protein ASYMMETRIC LEAVES 2-like [Rhododendron vialii]|uniref:protein ASYMMETRIC LEAVES 2-like n=1 Tax=Rhododendron vialii TaxID=182163 RepID=UPI00265D7A47|nr:protein ASYMMETRIC LEAVES 2-like [Rhododendron vialii]
MSNTNTSTPINTNPTIPNTNTNTTRFISPGSSSSSASQACAACKYQRRRCAPDCPMAPHFPPTQPKNFGNVQKLFGVCNFLKLLRMVQPSQQHAAAKSMVVQANVRAIEPVGGCYQIIRELERQIEQCKAEFELVLGQLAIYRARAERARKMGNPSLAGGDSGFVDVDALCVYNPMHVQAVDYDGRFQGQDPLYMDLGCYDNVGVKIDMEASSSMAMVVNDPKQVYVDMKPLVGIYNEKQHAIAVDSKELIESRFAF